MFHEKQALVVRYFCLEIKVQLVMKFQLKKKESIKFYYFYFIKTLNFYHQLIYQRNMVDHQRNIDLSYYYPTLFYFLIKIKTQKLKFFLCQFLTDEMSTKKIEPYCTRFYHKN